MRQEHSQFPLLDELTEAGRARLLAATRRVRLVPHAPVLQRGDEVAGAYLVERGALRVFYISADGREGTLYWIDPGQPCILALNCLFARLAYPAWVEADHAETDVAVISGDAYRDLFASEPALQRFTFGALATRLFDLMTLMQETASLGLEQRVATLLYGGQARPRPRDDARAGGTSLGFLARSCVARAAQHPRAAAP